jgi:hypothetical protein
MSNPEHLDDQNRDDPRSTEELIGLVLTKDMDADNEEYWRPIRSLQRRLPSIIESIDKLLESDSPKVIGVKPYYWLVHVLFSIDITLR